MFARRLGVFSVAVCLGLSGLAACAAAESPTADASGGARPNAGGDAASGSGGDGAGVSSAGGAGGTASSAAGTGTVSAGSGGTAVAGSGGSGGVGVVAELDAKGLRARAEAAMVPLSAFYNADTGLWDQDDWWTSANQLETVIDYARESGDPKYTGQIETTFTKNQVGNFDKWGYYDDDGWWAIAWIKAFDLSHQQKYLSMAKTIFTRMAGGWDTKCGGGIYWASAKAGAPGLKNKNAIPNSLFLQVAAMLHLRTPGDAGPGSYLDWAEREWAWFKASGMLSDKKQVVDGLNDLTNCKAEGPVFTYNQGVLVGGLVELAAAKNDPALLDEATAIADATIALMANSSGVLKEAPCGGDICVQFKGVFMRNLALLHGVRPSSKYQEYMLRQSDVLWLDNRNGEDQFGYEWHLPFDKASAARQSSGLDALIAAVRSSSMNLALGAIATGPAPCTASSPAALAFDGSSRWDSKWCAGGAGGQTLTADLGAARDVIGFRVRHAGAGGENVAWNTRDFELQTSADGQAWATVVTVAGNTSSVTTHPIVPVSARHVRLHVTAAQTDPELLAARIYELEVFGENLQ